MKMTLFKKLIKKDTMRVTIKKITIKLFAFLFFLQIGTFNVMATSGDQIQGKITAAMTVIQGILTSIIVIVGICVSLFNIIKKMPDSDNPHEKHELYKGVGRLWGLVALGGACIWLVPWIYNLFK